MILHVFLVAIALAAQSKACSEISPELGNPSLEKDFMDDNEMPVRPDEDAITKDLERSPESRMNSFDSMFSNFPNLSEEPQTAFTEEEVSQYDGRDGRPLYIIVDGSVYDITDFVPYHPGGKEVLLEHGGQDVTQEMRDSPMPEIVYSNFLHMFLIGWVVY